MNIKNLFFFDIETCGNYSTLDDFRKSDARGAELFEHKYAKKQKKGDWNESPQAAYINNSPILCEYGKIICLSMAYINKDGSVAANSIVNENENELIIEACNVFEKIDEIGLKLCGFNIKGFDIPWLCKKMYMYGIRPPKCLSMFEKKPWELNILDLMDVWKGTGFEANTFDEVAYSLGIPSPKDGEVNGSSLHSFYWETKNIDAIRKYCERDVKTLVEICKKLENLL